MDSFLKHESYLLGSDHSALSYWKKFINKDGYDKSVLIKVSPANFASSFVAPVLLIHGEHDDTVPIEQSKIMASALKKANKSVELITLKGETHYLENNATRLETLHSILLFLNKNLK